MSTELMPFIYWINRSTSREVKKSLRNSARDGKFAFANFLNSARPAGQLSIGLTPVREGFSSVEVIDEESLNAIVLASEKVMRVANATNLM